MRCKLVFLLLFFLVGCLFYAFHLDPEKVLGEVPSGDPAFPPLNVIIIWHHHQPLYKVPGGLDYMMPWVRAHGVNDYPYMADLVEDYLENGKVTFNIVPSLLLQINDYLKGAEDEYMRLSMKPEEELTEDERKFIIEHFFDINPRFVNAHARYRELMEKKVNGLSFSDQDILDLKVCWNLYWVNIDYIKEDSVLSMLMEKDGGYTRQDLQYVLKKHLELMTTIVPKYRRLWKEGRIELITSPMYHPILPLLIDMGWEEDAKGQILKGLKYFSELFGTTPTGIWPPEEAVSDETARIFAEIGIKWFVTDKSILQKSGVDTGDYRNLMKPYKLVYDNGEIVVFFRDTDLSNRISFSYSQMSAEEAVKDFISRLHQLQRLNKDGTLVLTVALDGENAWEHYPNNGNDFRKLLYETLSLDPYVRLTTPSEYLEKYKVSNTLTKLAKGSWAGGELDVWIGEKEEDEAWMRLKKARRVFKEVSVRLKPDVREEALDVLYAAEGSDWFWWYGADQDAGNNEILFDMQFKNLLVRLYQLCGYERAQIPAYLFVPNKRPAIPTGGALRKVEYVIDGHLSDDEKGRTAFFVDMDSGPIKGVYVGRGDNSVYLAVELNRSASDYLGKNVKLEVYMSSPHAELFNAVTRYSSSEKPTELGFALSHCLSLNFKLWTKRKKVSPFLANGKEKWILTAGRFNGAVDDVVELEIPYEFLKVKSGEEFDLAVVWVENRKDLDYAPNSGPVRVSIPVAVTGKVIAEFVDPEGDEHGPGSYVYPKDPSFAPYKGLFDLLKVRVLENEEALVFQFWFAEMTNPWNAPKGFSHQLINLYIDSTAGGRTDTYSKGARVSFDEKHPWDYFIKVAGWPNYGRVFATVEGEEVPEAIRIEADLGEKLINVIVFKKYLEVRPSRDIYVYILVGSQDGYGPDHFRPVTPEPSQWTLGGYPKDAGEYAPFVVDIVVPKGFSQEEILSSYDPSHGKYATLIPVVIKLE